MKVDVKVEINAEAIKSLEGAAAQAMRATVEWVKTEVTIAGVVPKDTGALENSAWISEVSPLIYRLIYDTPYARRWYFNAEGVSFNQSKNASARDHWLDDFIYGSRNQEILDVFGQFLKDYSGGIVK